MAGRRRRKKQKKNQQQANEDSKSHQKHKKMPKTTKKEEQVDKQEAEEPIPEPQESQKTTNQEILPYILETLRPNLYIVRVVYPILNILYFTLNIYNIGNIYTGLFTPSGDIEYNFEYKLNLLFNPIMILLTLLNSLDIRPRVAEEEAEFARYHSFEGEDVTKQMVFFIKEQKFDEVFLDLINLVNLLLSGNQDLTLFISNCYIGISTFRRLKRDHTLMKVSLLFTDCLTLDEEFVNGRYSSRLIFSIIRYFCTMIFLIFLFLTFKSTNDVALQSPETLLNEAKCRMVDGFFKIADQEIGISNVKGKFKQFILNEGKIDIDEMRNYLSRRFQEEEVKKQKKRIQEDLGKEVKAKKRQKGKKKRRRSRKKPKHRRKHNRLETLETINDKNTRWNITMEVKKIETKFENALAVIMTDNSFLEGVIAKEFSPEKTTNNLEFFKKHTKRSDADMEIIPIGTSESSYVDIIYFKEIQVAFAVRIDGQTGQVQLMRLTLYTKSITPVITIKEAEGYYNLRPGKQLRKGPSEELLGYMSKSNQITIFKGLLFPMLNPVTNIKVDLESSGDFIVDYKLMQHNSIAVASESGFVNTYVFLAETEKEKENGYQMRYSQVQDRSQFIQKVKLQLKPGEIVSAMDVTPSNNFLLVATSTNQVDGRLHFLNFMLKKSSYEHFDLIPLIDYTEIREFVPTYDISAVIRTRLDSEILLVAFDNNKSDGRGGLCIFYKHDSLFRMKRLSQLEFKSPPYKFYGDDGTAFSVDSDGLVVSLSNKSKDLMYER